MPRPSGRDMRMPVLFCHLLTWLFLTNILLWKCSHVHQTWKHFIMDTYHNILQLTFHCVEMTYLSVSLSAHQSVLFFMMLCEVNFGYQDHPLNIPACISWVRVQYLFAGFLWGFFWCRVYVRWNAQIFRVCWLSFGLCTHACNPNPQQHRQLLSSPPEFALCPYPVNSGLHSTPRRTPFWFVSTTD